MCLEREASHSRVEGRVFDSLLASAHALVDSHSHTASKTSQVKTRALALETYVAYIPTRQGRRKRMAISRATCAASDSKDPSYLAHQRARYNA